MEVKHCFCLMAATQYRTYTSSDRDVLECCWCKDTLARAFTQKQQDGHGPFRKIHVPIRQDKDEEECPQRVASGGR